MSKLKWDPMHQTVRPKAKGGVPVLMCLLVAGLTALVVYRWGFAKWLPVRAKPTFTATAYVVGPADENAAAARPGIAAPGGQSHFRGGKANSQGNVSRAAEIGTVPGKSRVPFAGTSADPQAAQKAAHALAEAFISDQQKGWKASVDKQLSETRQAVEETRRRHDESMAQLAAFEKTLRDAEARDQSATADAKPRAAMVMNPRWLELERQSAELTRRREELMIDRTPLHPAVMEVSDKIVEIERKMADIPREIPDAKAEAEIEAAERQAVERLAQSGGRKHAELAAAVNQTRKDCAAAEFAARQAAERRKSPPRYSIGQAGVLENPPPVDYGWRRLMWTTLATGLMMVFGFGTLSLGTGIEPPVATAAEVREKTRKSIIGRIPDEDAAVDPARIGRQWLIRRTTIGLGLLLMLLCPAVAIWGVLGI